MLEAYRKHVEERAAEGVVPKPLDAHQVAELVELVKNPPAGEEDFILNLLENRIPQVLTKPPMLRPVSWMPLPRVR